MSYTKLIKPLLLPLLVALLVHPTAAGRDVVALSKWAKDQGVFLHDKLEWKDYGEEDWGLVLKDPVERGTVLLKVPRHLVLDSTVLRKEYQAVATTKTECVEILKEALGDFALHEENFWIVLQLYRFKCNQQPPSSHRFSPWLDAMPTTFPQFTPAEMECLPFYAQYAAQYVDKKFQAFCQAVEALGEKGFSANNPKDVSTLKWAFQAVNSRFWKTNPLEGAKQLDMVPTSELVPLGDMMNHRDPPNVQMVPEDPDHVCFAYMGDDADETSCASDENYERDLFLTYGQPGNPHRFLVIFGFVPNAQYMPNVWSHLVYGDTNPYGSAAQVDNMVFHVNDGTVSQQVWDAILWELWEPSSQEEFLQDREQRHRIYKDLIVDVLESHVDRQLEELALLRPKIETTIGPNMAMIRQQNEFLTSVFTKVKNNLNGSVGTNN